MNSYLMNNDVDIFVKFLNKSDSKSGSKRNREKLESINIIGDIKMASLERLREASSKDLKLNGRELLKHLTNLKEAFEMVVLGFKKDKQLEKDVPELIRLWLIAEFSVCIDMLDEIQTYSKNYKSKTFNQCMDYMSNKIKKQFVVSKIPKYESANFISIKLNNKDDEEDDIEEDSEVEDSEEEIGSGDDDDDDDDDTLDDDDSILNKKVGRDFVHQIFKTKNEDDEEEIMKYYTNLNDIDKNEALEKIKEINSYQAGDKPILFQIMELPLPIGQKNHILKNYTSLATSRYPDNKLKTWFDALMTVPFGKYKGINLDSIKSKKVKVFLDNLQETMDKAVFGHEEAKRQIIQMMGQQIRNPKSKGNVIGIYGCPGNGKTSLVKDGIAKAMDKPFVFISLGGATDASFLEGHSYTYEGSIYGRIVNGLITSKCMDPIIYFDELDKISKTHKGDEITNLLVHLTDPVQNSHFRDKYFHGVDIDLSRATIIFSFNDPSNVNPILMDRITNIETKYLMVSQKLHIAKNYLLPEMMKEMGLNNNDIVINDDTIREIIDKYTYEGGVRKLKSTLYSLCREINLANLLKSTIDDQRVKFPFTVQSHHVKTLLKHKIEIDHDKIHNDDKPGVVNGLWANSLGNGGVLSIETMLVPSTSFLSVKATGHLEKVIKESTEVATSLAWNYLPEDVKSKYLVDSKDKPLGIHIHCPDGATPKDGPSAGAALTIALYSLLTGKKIRHDIAMTGEINLEGKVTAIGGLEEKLEGAKRAGVKLVLFPKENVKHLDKIKERNLTLLDDNFKVIPIESFEEVIKYSIL